AVAVFDADGKPVRGVPGELVCTRPFPSMPVRFWNDPDGAKYRAAYFEYFPGVWRHGDWAELTEHDGLVIYGRSDATLNPAGVRIGTAEIYRQVEQLPEVVESLVVGQEWEGDVRVVLFVRLRDGVRLDEELRERIRRRIREQASPHHVPRRIIQVADIPRTVSGKITELAVRDVIHGRPVTLRTISRFFEYALALSAWKEAGGTRWALRSNPSSGNLHPTEGYLIMNGMPALLPTPGVYHYAPKEHTLERRADIPSDAFFALMKEFPPHAFLVAFTSIHWREAWKYGERAYRYCQHDAGHAVGTARIAAATLGWKMVLLEDVGDDLIATLLGINRKEDYLRAEPEHPDCIAVVWPPDSQGSTAETDSPKPISLPLFLAPEAVRAIAAGTWYGKANRLSRRNPD
ncbi:MAG: hypothetical protein C4293_16310, partial [Nitrospiraceae bacterium]